MSRSERSTSTAECAARSLAHYRQLYEDADTFAREVAEFRESVSIPAHNELRYAGHHLLQALDDGGSVANREQLRRACSHCERAMYEAAEAGIISLLTSIGQFQRDYRDIVISEVVPRYGECKALARKAREQVIRGRSESDSATTTASEHMRAFRELRVAGDLLEDARDDLNAKLTDRQRKSRQFIVTTAIAVLGVAATLAFIVHRLTL